MAEKLNRIFKGRDVLAADPGEVKALCDAFNSYMGSKPTLQVRAPVCNCLFVVAVVARVVDSLVTIYEFDAMIKVRSAGWP